MLFVISLASLVSKLKEKKKSEPRPTATHNNNEVGCQSNIGGGFFTQLFVTSLKLETDFLCTKNRAEVERKVQLKKI